MTDSRTTGPGWLPLGNLLARLLVPYQLGQVDERTSWIADCERRGVRPGVHVALGNDAIAVVPTEDGVSLPAHSVATVIQASHPAYTLGLSLIVLQAEILARGLPEIATIDTPPDHRPRWRWRRIFARLT